MSSEHLLLAAQEGNVEFLLEALASQPIGYFLTRMKSKNGQEHYNIMHIAVLNEQTEFLKGLLERLPIATSQMLLCQQDSSYFNYNPLHCAMLRGNLAIVRLMIKFCKSVSSSSKPWLAVDINGKSPFLVALDRKREECAIEIMELDGEVVCNMADNKGTSPLFEAVQRGCVQVVMKILTSGFSYSIFGEDQMTPLHVIPNCSEEVCTLVLDKHPEMLKKASTNGLTIMHKWVMMGQLWPFEFLLNRKANSKWRKEFIDLLSAAEKSTGNNPLHTAASMHTEDILQAVQLLVKAYIDAYEQGDVLQHSPWNFENKNGETPLILSLVHKNEKLARYFIALDVENLVIHATKSILYCAVQHRCDEVAADILASVAPSHFRLIQLKGNDGKNVLHVASNCTERTCNLLVENLPWLINEPDDNGKTALDVASEAGNAWLIKLLLTKDPSSITSAPFAWIEACKKGHLEAIYAFIDAPDFRTFCFQRKDSPLHHIELKSYRDYKDFLAIPLIQEMKNMVDFDGATPLHRALDRKDILFVEALLSGDGVLRNIKDKNGKTATHLLKKLGKEHYEWEEMCERIQINPRLRTNFMTYPTMQGTRERITSAEEIRGTLSIVAALLATLTFAAGFTLPGGLDQDVGEALLSKKAPFLVFIIADTYAMCCSMLVLFCLIWSMSGDRYKSLLLIDRSVVILVQALYGTLVAFMTGVYTTISHKSLWAAIVVIVMCSIVAISANRAILDKVLDKLIPSSVQERVVHRRRYII
ncbi:unnamed protein product [Amaranthus hypochondriacus]